MSRDLFTHCKDAHYGTDDFDPSSPSTFAIEDHRPPPKNITTISSRVIIIIIILILIPVPSDNY
jgi:hypothetical protein